MENDFRAVLLADATVSGLIATRIYPATYPQGAANPAIRFQKVTGSIGLHMQGSDGLAQDIVQVDIRALTAGSAMAVRDAVIARLHGYRGDMGNTEFQLIELSPDRGLDFEKTDAESFYTASMDFNVSWRSV